jgi:hypothetical protein
MFSYFLFALLYLADILYWKSVYNAVKTYGILKVKNALLKYMYYVTE